MLALLTVNLPLPILASEPFLPLDPSWMIPEKAVLRLLAPIVNFLAPRITTPFPSRDPIVSPGELWPLIYIVPLLTLLVPSPKTSIRDVPPRMSVENSIILPSPPFDPGLAIIIAFPTVDVASPWKSVYPPKDRQGYRHY